MNVATYIKFDDIANALVEPLKPTRLASFQTEPSTETGSAPPRTGQRPRPQLDASFNVQLALSDALDKLQHGSISMSSQQTPALGKYS